MAERFRSKAQERAYAQGVRDGFTGALVAFALIAENSAARDEFKRLADELSDRGAALFRAARGSDVG